MAPSFLICAVALKMPLTLLPFVILFHRQGFSYAAISNNVKASYLVTLAVRLIVLPGQSRNLQTAGLKIILCISPSALAHCCAETTYLTSRAHYPAVLAGFHQGRVGISLRLSGV
jgi:hypothetical protein